MPGFCSLRVLLALASAPGMRSEGTNLTSTVARAREQRQRWGQTVRVGIRSLPAGCPTEVKVDAMSQQDESFFQRTDALLALVQSAPRPFYALLNSKDQLFLSGPISTLPGSM